MNKAPRNPRNPRSKASTAKRRIGRTRTSMKITRVFKSMIVAMVIAGALLMVPTAAHAAVFVGVGFAPPAIPIYAQPIAPGYGYIWTPGYWAYGPDGYYWVDGAWIRPTSTPSGLPAIGVGAAEATSGTPATGDATSATTAASTTASATSA